MGRTFSIIKPDATKRNLTGAINAMIEGAGLRIVAQKRVHMTQTQAERFSAVHAERPFFRELGEPELGFALLCSMDDDTAEEYGQGEVALKRTGTIMQGAPHCDFRYRLRR